MTREQTREDNILIAEFMGIILNAEKDKCSHPLISAPWPPIEALKYRSSWNYLMPVVEKIEDCKVLSDVGMNINIYNCITEIKCKWRGNILSTGHGKTRMQACYFAVIDFIKWYNTQNK